jgi:hypothetical protein
VMDQMFRSARDQIQCFGVGCAGVAASVLQKFDLQDGVDLLLDLQQIGLPAMNALLFIRSPSSVGVGTARFSTPCDHQARSGLYDQSARREQNLRGVA